MNLNRVWDEESYKEYIEHLLTYKNDQNKNFSEKLIFTNYEIIGIKNPDMIMLAKEIAKGDYESFIKNANYKYFEEVNITGLIIASIKDKDTFYKHFDLWIKKVDNWASCDMVICKIYLAKNDDSLFQYALQLLKSKEEFIIRVGIVILMDFYLKDNKYIDEIISNIDAINSEFYYVNMAIAWLLSVAFVKHREVTLKYLQNNKLNKFTHNKAIQKCIESRRVSNSDKDLLKLLRK